MKFFCEFGGIGVGVAQGFPWLRPGLRWTLEFCHRKVTANGVVASDTDELEGRIPSGKANLNTSALCCDALRHAA